MIYTGNKEGPLDKDLQAEYMQILGGEWVGRCAGKTAVQRARLLALGMPWPRRACGTGEGWPEKARAGWGCSAIAHPAAG